MQSQCSCPKWYDALDLDAVFALIDRYEAHPVYSKGFRACSKSLNPSSRGNHFGVNAVKIRSF